ncbi:MAG: hypothetical protein GY856_37760 [bacterium]|nr:hypothetical protein [bacterium]
METFVTTIDRLASPPILFALALLLFVIGVKWRGLWSRLGGLVSAVLLATFLGVSLSDEGFRRLVLDPERLPVLGLVLLSGFFLWLSRHRAQDRDARNERLLPDAAWPGFSSGELGVAMLVLLVVAACAFLARAPVAAVADPAFPPNPAKAPWFLVGLQEMRVYFDAWVPGVLLPGLILVFLVALPHLDRQPSDGDRTPFEEAHGGVSPEPVPPGGDKWGVAPGLVFLFLFGWWLLWVLPMVIGAFLRGPHWNAFGPFEPWDAARPHLDTAVPLSELLWSRLLDLGPPESWLLRELPGIALVGLYFGFLPLLLPWWKVTRSIFARTRKRLGGWRFYVATVLVLAMMIVPLKMISWWLFDVEYLIHLPEWSFNF